MNTLESEWLLCLGACGEAREYCATQPDLATAWAQCERGDWMLWLLGRVTTSAPWSNERKPLVACALECAALALPSVHDMALRGRIADAAGVVLAWTRGGATEEEVQKARGELDDIAYAYAYAAAAAYATASTASTASAAYAAYAAYAADAADAAASAASAASAAYAAYAAYAAAYAYDGAMRQAADIVRRHFPSPPSMERMP